MADRVITDLDEEQCLRLISPGEWAASPTRAGAWAEQAGVESWPEGNRELFMRIVPSRITGRRVAPAHKSAGFRIAGTLTRA